MLNDDRIFLVTTDRNMTSIFINKLMSTITETTEKRIVIISENSYAFYFTLIYALQEAGYSDSITYKTQNAIQVNKNWIHIIKPSSFNNIRGYRITDMYIQDYDDISEYHKEILLSLLPIYDPEVLWIWGTKMNDKFINPVIKNGYRNYLLGRENGMKFLSDFEESVDELHKRIN